MMISWVYVLGGIALLLWSAGWFVAGAAAISRRLGVSALVVGMVVVGFGTSAPEVAVSVFSAVEGKPGLALGNALGSNITNLALILGLTALLNPIRVSSGLVRKEMPALILVTLLALGLMADMNLSRLDGVLLLGVFAVVMAWMLWVARGGVKSGLDPQEVDALTAEVEHSLATHPLSLGGALARLLIGLLVLLASSRLLVIGAVDLAQRAGMSELVIGLTVVAVGTSLPELASALVAARRGEHDLVLGNVLGSNIFNTLLVMGAAVVIQPSAVEPSLFWRDMMVTLGLTLALPLVALAWRHGRLGRINRTEGLFLVLAYVGYTVYLLTTAAP
jgi:cation:H+ antiporter